MFYLVIFCLLSIFSLIELTNINTNFKFIIYVVSYLILLFVAGFRYETGGDWTSYSDFFKEIESIGDVFNGKATTFNSSYMELGFKILNSIVKSCGGGVQTVFFLVSLFTTSILFISVKEYLKYPLLGILIYFGSMYFFLDMVATRQSVAVIIFFGSIRYIFKNQFFYYLIAILAATLFHRSAGLLFPLYFLLNKVYTKTFYIITFAVCASVFFLHLKWMTWLLITIAQKIGGNNEGIIIMYITSSTYSVSRTFSIGTVVIFIVFFINIFKRNDLLKIPYYNCFFNLFIFNVITYFVFYEFIEISNRYRYYFLTSNVILLPSLLLICKKTINRISIWGLISGFSFLYGRNIFLENPNSAAYNPYQNYIMHLLFNTKSTGKKRLEKSDEEFIKSREN